MGWGVGNLLVSKVLGELSGVACDRCDLDKEEVQM